MDDRQSAAPEMQGNGKPAVAPGGRLDRFAFAVSAVTSPFLVAGLTALAVAWLLHPTWLDIIIWGGITGLSTAVIPFLIVFLLWRTGRVTDMHVALREQRTIPFIGALVSAACGLVALRAAGAPTELIALGAAFMVNGMVLTVVTLAWKASIHAATLAGCILGLTMVGSLQFLWLGLALPVVFWARMRRNRHTLAQGIVPVVLVSVLTPIVYYCVTGWLESG
ncbi:MAG: hypothetical protein HPY44_18660 [Armatimonadetes bacterium]|nr:hypothetical protein [Armatimonadota bacterium]